MALNFWLSTVLYRFPLKIIEFSWFTEQSCLQNPIENLQFSRFSLITLKREAETKQPYLLSE